ncbi:uncharacterized protein J3R85_004206 [Psidium guajava]|nr:uncharacterized protein J3R85_004206 [Psidium guajava]
MAYWLLSLKERDEARFCRKSMVLLRPDSVVNNRNTCGALCMQVVIGVLIMCLDLRAY